MVLYRFRFPSSLFSNDIFSEKHRILLFSEFASFALSSSFSTVLLANRMAYTLTSQRLYRVSSSCSTGLCVVVGIVRIGIFICVEDSFGFDTDITGFFTYPGDSTDSGNGPVIGTKFVTGTVDSGVGTFILSIVMLNNGRLSLKGIYTAFTLAVSNFRRKSVLPPGQWDAWNPPNMGEALVNNSNNNKVT